MSVSFCHVYLSDGPIIFVRLGHVVGWSAPGSVLNRLILLKIQRRMFVDYVCSRKPIFHIPFQSTLSFLSFCIIFITSYFNTCIYRYFYCYYFEFFFKTVSVINNILHVVSGVGVCSYRLMKQTKHTLASTSSCCTRY